MNPYVMRAYPLDDYRLDLVFENGKRRIFDIKPYFQRGIFSRLQNKATFQAVRVVAGSVEWPGGFDLGATALISLAEYRNKKPFWVRFSGFAGISTTETVSKSGEMVQSPMSPWQKSVFLCDSPILSG